MLQAKPVHKKNEYTQTIKHIFLGEHLTHDNTIACVMCHKENTNTR